jgi:hypothetical protein
VLLVAVSRLHRLESRCNIYLERLHVYFLDAEQIYVQVFLAASPCSASHPRILKILSRWLFNAPPSEFMPRRIEF